VGLDSQCVATLPSDYGHRLRLQSSTADVDVRPATASVVMPKDVVFGGAIDVDRDQLRCRG